MLPVLDALYDLCLVPIPRHIVARLISSRVTKHRPRDSCTPLRGLQVNFRLGISLNAIA